MEVANTLSTHNATMISDPTGARVKLYRTLSNYKVEVCFKLTNLYGPQIRSCSDKIGQFVSVTRFQINSTGA